MKSELQIQAAAFQWAWNTYPHTRRLLFHVPNGGYRSKVEAANMKASGVVPGIPDMLLLWKGRAHAFEFKTTSGRASPEQVKVHHAWIDQNIPVYVVRSVEDFKQIFKSIIIQNA